MILAIPEGNERAGCVILGRLCNGIDKFPMKSIAGQDPTTNTFAFSRRRTPKVEEVNGPWLIAIRAPLPLLWSLIRRGGYQTMRFPSVLTPSLMRSSHAEPRSPAPCTTVLNQRLPISTLTE